MEKTVYFNTLRRGDLFIVCGYTDKSAITFRLRELGLIEGTTASVYALSPLGGTVAIKFFGGIFALSRDNLKKIKVKKI